MEGGYTLCGSDDGDDMLRSFCRSSCELMNGMLFQPSGVGNLARKNSSALFFHRKSKTLGQPHAISVKSHKHERLIISLKR